MVFRVVIGTQRHTPRHTLHIVKNRIRESTVGNQGVKVDITNTVVFVSVNSSPAEKPGIFLNVGKV